MTRRVHPRLPVPGGAGRLLDGQGDADPRAIGPDGVAEAGLRQRHRPEAGIERRRDPGHRGLGHAGPAPANQPAPRVTRRTRRSSSSSTRCARRPTSIRPRSVAPRSAAGLDGGRRDRDRERDPLAGQVADGHVDGDDRPGQRVRARQGHPASLHDHVQAPDLTRPIPRARQRHGVADEDEPAGRLGAQDDRP